MITPLNIRPWHKTYRDKRRSYFQEDNPKYLKGTILKLSILPKHNYLQQVYIFFILNNPAGALYTNMV